MPKKVKVSTLQANTIDILNTIRANASPAYQASIPAVTNLEDVRQVGAVFRGYPVFANEFLNALINRIALVKVQSMIFNNPYRELKKGFLEYGETIEDIFVDIAKVQEYDAEKAPAREFKRTIPDVRAVFYAINWKVVYPVTVEPEDMNRAFLSLEGVTDLISRLTDTVYKASEYDEFLMVKYLIIKAVTSGKMAPIALGAGSGAAAKAFRGISNKLTFPSRSYNEEGVLTNTPRDRQYIFMTAQYEADYDVDTLAAAFNMDKATFYGHLMIIDDWTTFDNDRFAEITKNTNMLSPVTAAELTLMADVDAIIVDGNWFQLYDNLIQFKETPVGSGLYWNYWLHNWKTYAHSPFANAVVFVKNGTALTDPASFVYTVSEISKSDIATVYTLEPKDVDAIVSQSVQFVETQAAVQAGIAVQRYGAYMLPAGQTTVLPVLTYKGKTYTAGASIDADTTVGTELTFTA